MLRQIIRYNSKWHRQQRIRDHKFYSFYICTYHGHYLCCAENAIISEYNSPCNTNYELKYFHWNMLQEFAVPIQSKVQHNGKFRLPYRMQLNLLQNRIYLDSKTIFLAYHLVHCLLFNTSTQQQLFLLWNSVWCLSLFNPRCYFLTFTTRMHFTSLMHVQEMFIRCRRIEVNGGERGIE